MNAKLEAVAPKPQPELPACLTLFVSLIRFSSSLTLNVARYSVAI